MTTRDPVQREALVKEFTVAINRHSAENGSDTPGFLLGEYLVGCLESFEQATMARDMWHGFDTPTEDGAIAQPNPGAGVPPDPGAA